MNNRGVVLMSVMWIVIVVSMIALTLAAAVRVEVAVAENAFDSERAQFMAKSAAEAVLLHLQSPGVFDGSPVSEQNNVFTFPFESGDAQVRLDSGVGLIDANGASDKLLASMFESLGVSELTKNQLVDSILDWRDSDDVPRLYGAEINQYGQVPAGLERLPRNGPFQSLEELLLVKNMTPRIYYGNIVFDEASNSHRKTPGLRDLMTVGSGEGGVNINEAPADVLAAVPGVSRDLAARLVEERNRKPFRDSEDIVARASELNGSEALDYLSTRSGQPSAIVATATVRPSGTSRTVRLNIRRERKVQVIAYVPFMYREVFVIHPGRWQY
jgi:general secretion pathway protein K